MLVRTFEAGAGFRLETLLGEPIADLVVIQVRHLDVFAPMVRITTYLSGYEFDVALWERHGAVSVGITTDRSVFVRPITQQEAECNHEQ